MQTLDSELLTTMQQWREDIPLLSADYKGNISQIKNNNPLIYLDSAATALKPRAVIDSLVEYYSEYPANIHRGSYPLSMRASEAYEDARVCIKHFVSANDDYELLFTAGMTAGSNFVAQAHELMDLENPEILITGIEHHSSYLPWVELCKRLKVEPHFIPMEASGRLNMQVLEETIKGIIKKSSATQVSNKEGSGATATPCRILTISGMSNVTGYVPPLADIYKLCQEAGIKMIIDAAQLVAHKEVNLTETPFDAILFSAHKLGGPTGIGALCIKKDWLNTFSQVISGGGTVDLVTQEQQIYLQSPERFEAGTPHIAGAIGFARAVQYLNTITWPYLEAYEAALRRKLIQNIIKLKEVRILGDLDLSNSAILSFVSKSLHAQDLGFFLEQKNICVRNGTLCAQPLLIEFKADQVTRVSAYGYNSLEDIQALGEALETMAEFQ